MTDQPTIDPIADVTDVLNKDETALGTQQMDIQAQIDALTAQIAKLQADIAALQAQKGKNAESLFRIGLIRTYVATVAAGQAGGAVVVPAAPAPALTDASLVV